MFGWMLIFVFMTLIATLVPAPPGLGFAFVMTTRIVFGALLLLSALTRLLRRRA
jgi:hypothetical protein